MTHVQVDPAFRALERDHHIRAQMADAAIKADIAQVASEVLLTPEQRAAKKAALEERFAKRVVRRARESAKFGSYTHPGVWDDDLDNYPDERYRETVEEYTIELKRHQWNLTWLGYIYLPDGHPAIGKHYVEINDAGPPVALSYGGMDSAGWHDGEVGMYGFYLENAVKPRNDGGLYDEHNNYSLDATGSTYYDYAAMREICLRLVEFFKDFATAPAKVPPPWTCSACGESQPADHDVCEYCGTPHRRSRRPLTCAEMALCCCVGECRG